MLEGGEGSGKTTAIQALAQHLRHEGRDVLVTREPGGTPEGLALRALLLASGAPDWDPAAELLLITAARIQHVKRVIKPALAAGKIVLCDRFIGSTLAYQGAGRGLPDALILDLHNGLVGIWPDLTVTLDIDPQTGLSRSARRLADMRVNEGRFEAESLAFHAKVRAAFLLPAYGGAHMVIDASQPAAEVAAAVLGCVRRFLDG